MAARLFLFFLFLKFILCPIHQPLNIRPMPPPGQCREYQTESKHHPLSRIKDQHQNRKQCRNGQRTHGDISCCKEYNRKYNRSDQGDAHIQCEHETTGCRNAFAALKMHIKGIIVPDNNAKSLSIAAASIIAKVTRDRMMREYDKLFPEYDFAKNKGYGTAEHVAALKTFGPTPIHRRSFISNFI